MSPRPKARIYHPSIMMPASVSADGDFISWEDHHQDAPWRRPTDRTVLAFARLRHATATQIVDFASRNGVLRAFEIKPEFKRETDVSFTDGSVWRVDALPHGAGKEPIYLWQSLA